MKIGGWQVDAVETGTFWLDGGAMFGVVPWTMWSRTNPPDDKNRIELGMRALLLRGHGRTVLVDCGAGDKWSAKMQEIYRFEGSLEKGLAAVGAKVGDVTDLLLTHLHFDHAGGLSKLDQAGGLELTFPKAKHWLQKSNLAWARDPHEREKASYLPEHVGPVAEAPGLELLDGPEEIYPGLRLHCCDGHTPGQQLPVVSGPEGSVFFCADLVPTATHLPVTWVMGYDLNPLQSMKEKKYILERASREDWMLVYEHDPRLHGTRVMRDEKGRFQPKGEVRL